MSTLPYPALAVGATRAAWLARDGELVTLTLDEAAKLAQREPPLVVHRNFVARRLGLDRLQALDLLELYAFIHPAKFCLPTPRGLARALDLTPPGDLEDEAAILPKLVGALLDDAIEGKIDQKSDPVEIAQALLEVRWPWAAPILSALGAPLTPPRTRNGLSVWSRLPEWREEAPPDPPGTEPVDPADARRRLAELTGVNAEPRPSQADYASAVSLAFAPREDHGVPIAVLAEAGTGVGKTLGYLAPATLWAEKNGAPVWISTYTRNLQHQIDTEAARRWPDPIERAKKVVLRKGRENYLCLLNYDDALRGAAATPATLPALGLIARWIAATRDGDLGGDLPGWLVDLLGRVRISSLADKRGECVYGACEHHKRCFVERSVRAAREADLVVANHALVMVRAARGDEADLPSRYVFDEGHHIFDAADSAFAAHLTGLETSELRRWLIGAEAARSSRARGIKRRIEDLVREDEDAKAAIDAIGRAAQALPGEGWPTRIGGDGAKGAAELFLAAVRRQVYARAEGSDGPYSIECDVAPAADDVREHAANLRAALDALATPMRDLAKRLRARLEEEGEYFEADTRTRMDAMARALERREQEQLTAWRAMLAELGKGAPDGLVDWFGVERIDGRDFDCGWYRHFTDPTAPFMASLAPSAHGFVVTSATLTDGSSDEMEDWRAAEQRTGVGRLLVPAVRARVPSPFDYAKQTRVFVVNDVRKDDLDQVAAAYRALFLAAGGGALGLFTAVARLKAVHARIAPAIEAAGLPILAQHVDQMDVQTLIEIFRGEGDACLLGTDAVRDGVDVPGRALRLIVFDRVPWPRPDLLHKARRAAFGNKAWDDRLTRLRLRQAFGRLVRRADDHGVFVLLDPMLPSRLAPAFPPGVDVVRCGLAEAVAATRDFLEPPARCTDAA
ncbi:ATP-dependent DNA helicase [Roseiterribacter gracilis]|uniref:DNA helicase n=1 Tax=Roseiterribacter gracilis TaxID=2812848 RepID=A0A8S8XDE9_9PROT|nr:DNA helicase [Rhodospirillales bacterium TMPK1]